MKGFIFDWRCDSCQACCLNVPGDNLDQALTTAADQHARVAKAVNCQRPNIWLQFHDLSDGRRLP